FATTTIYTLALHDALPISVLSCRARSLRRRLFSRRQRRTAFCLDRWESRKVLRPEQSRCAPPRLLKRDNRCAASCISSAARGKADRKSTRLNSSHEWISYA